MKRYLLALPLIALVASCSSSPSSSSDTIPTATIPATGTGASGTPSSLTPGSPTSIDPNSSPEDITISPSHTVPPEEWKAAVERAQNGTTTPEDLWFVLPQPNVFPEYVRSAGYWDDAKFSSENLSSTPTQEFPWAVSASAAATRSWKATSAARKEEHTITTSVLLFKDQISASSAIAALRNLHAAAESTAPMVYEEAGVTHTVHVELGPRVVILVDFSGPNSSPTVVSSSRLLAGVLAGRLAQDVRKP